MTLDPNFRWHWRVIGYNALGGVAHSVVIETEEALEAAHDAMQEMPEVKITMTFGPFRTGLARLLRAVS